MAAPLRYLSYTVDTVLLTAALMLATLLHQYPFVHAWLTAKILLLVLYVVLGSYALKRGSTRSVRIACWTAALLVYAMMVSIARAHHPLGRLVGLMRKQGSARSRAVCVFCAIAPSTVPLSVPMRQVRLHTGDSRITHAA